MIPSRLKIVLGLMTGTGEHTKTTLKQDHKEILKYVILYNVLKKVSK
jgi:hypothetical protein